MEAFLVLCAWIGADSLSQFANLAFTKEFPMTHRTHESILRKALGPLDVGVPLVLSDCFSPSSHVAHLKDTDAMLLSHSQTFITKREWNQKHSDLAPTRFDISELFSREVVFPSNVAISSFDNRRCKTLVSRKQSFNLRWQAPQSPETLADLGFYYIGEDIVKCFACGKKLRGWMPDDDPLIEHIKFTPTCPYLVLVFGINLIRHVRDTQGSLPTETEPQSEETLAKTLFGDCIICCDRAKRIVFLPCGHMETCARCAVSFDSCPVCRHPISEYCRVEAQ